METTVATDDTEAFVPRNLAEHFGITHDELEAMYAQAMGFAQAGLVDRALEALGALVQLHPTEHRFYRAIGILNQRERDYFFAMAMFEVAFTLDETDRVARLLHAECKALTGDIAGAVPLLQQALATPARNAVEAPYLARGATLLTRLNHIAARKSR